MMSDAWLADQFDLAAELFVPLSNDACVLVPRHDVVGIAEDMQQRHLRGSQRREVVDRILLRCESLVVVREVKAFEDQLPIAGASFPFSLAAGPALEIADRSVGVDARDFVRVRSRPVVAVQAAATQTDQRGLQ